eukprot:GHRQ01022328.1.p1 GENE.GHRQ01022328.1~~GHRQ01022328.1.p1  ORF type:complete len:137 (+),score=47.97 GHRQ01022328.1:169-579(+)
MMTSSDLSCMLISTIWHMRMHQVASLQHTAQKYCCTCCCVARKHTSCCRQAGFNHDYDCVSQDVPAYDHLIRVLPRCFTEVMLRIANPLREVFPGQHKNGPKGEQHQTIEQQRQQNLGSSNWWQLTGLQQSSQATC